MRVVLRIGGEMSSGEPLSEQERTLEVSFPILLFEKLPLDRLIDITQPS